MNKFFVGTLMAANAAAASQDSCTALVMSGGGSNGAWEIDKTLSPDPETHQFDFKAIMNCMKWYDQNVTRSSNITDTPPGK